MSSIGNKETFAANLLYYLRLSGKEQKEVAEDIGVPTSTFNEWAKGKKYPRIDKIEKLAAYFKIKKSDLIEDRQTTFDLTVSETVALTPGEEKIVELLRSVPEGKREMFITMFQGALEKLQ